MPHQATCSAPVGPGKSVTSLVLRDVKEVHLDFVKKVAQVVQNDGRVAEVDISAITTFTDTISSGNHTIVIS
jgi:hypothetical protein